MTNTFSTEIETLDGTLEFEEGGVPGTAEIAVGFGKYAPSAIIDRAGAEALRNALEGYFQLPPSRPDSARVS